MTSLLEDIDLICPGVLDNPYLGGHFPHPKQALFLGAHQEFHSKHPKKVYEALFGGAAGGGKSDSMLMAAAQMAWLYPGSSSVIIRRTFEELTEPGALLARAFEWWLGLPGVHWTGKKFIFPNGAQVSMGYHAHTKDDARYQSAEYQLVCFDELTYWPDDRAYMHLKSRIRRLDERSSVPLRLLSGANPGGPGHVWVRNRFVGGVDPVSGQLVQPSHHFFPATIADNPSLDQASYWESLGHLHPTRRAQLRDGDWEAREPGDYFRREWYGPLLDPEADAWPQKDKVTVRWWDLAASEKDDSSYTSGVKMSRHLSGVRAVEHWVAFRKTPGERDTMILQTAQADGYACVVGLEVEPGSGGIAQVLALEKRLKAKGFRVAYSRPKVELSKHEAKLLIRAARTDSAKARRAEPVASCLHRGWLRRGEADQVDDPEWGADQGCEPHQERDGIRLYAGPWTQGYLDRVEGFPETGLDEGDATSGAWYYLESKPAGLRRPPLMPKRPAAVADTHATHPEDLPEDVDGGKDRAGRWMP